MSKPLLTLGIVLALGTSGCAGFGMQQGPSLSAQIRQDQGIDPLWDYAKTQPTQGLEAPLYAEQHLDRLWDDYRPAAIEVEDASGFDTQRGADLWNPASVVRSWEIQGERPDERRSRGLLFGQELAAPAEVRF